MGSYVLGLVTAWVEAGSVRWPFFWAYAAAMLAAVALDFRSRLVVALATGLLLAASRHFGWISSWPRSRAIRWCAGISYSLFLVHFPVSLVVNALWSSHVPATPWLSLLGMLTAYATSMLVAVAFHSRVERPLVALGRGRRAPASVPALLDVQPEGGES
jgi:peptidoglycan/LPS O-acetylase OafA/YrhL